jgi:tetratricopeptide (TPR) repeat protein
MGAVLIFTGGGMLGAQDAAFFIQRAKEYAAQFNRDKAFESYDSALSVDPDNIRALNGRGGIYVQKGEYGKARLDFEKAYGIAKDDAETRHNLQFVYDFYRKNPALMNSETPNPATEPVPFKAPAPAPFSLNADSKSFEQISDYPKSVSVADADGITAIVAATGPPPPQPPDEAPQAQVPQTQAPQAQVPQAQVLPTQAPQAQVPQPPAPVIQVQLIQVPQPQVPAPSTDKKTSDGIIRKTAYPEVKIPQINGNIESREAPAAQAAPSPVTLPQAAPTPAALPQAALPQAVRTEAVSIRLNAGAGEVRNLPSAEPVPTSSSGVQAEGPSETTVSAAKVLSAAETANNTGIQLNKAGKYEKAIEQFTSAISYNPDFAIAYNNRGAAYFSIGEYEKASADFNKALRINPYYFDAHANREQVKIALASK